MLYEAFGCGSHGVSLGAVGRRCGTVTRRVGYRVASVLSKLSGREGWLGVDVLCQPRQRRPLGSSDTLYRGVGVLNVSDAISKSGPGLFRFPSVASGDGRQKGVTGRVKRRIGVRANFGMRRRRTFGLLAGLARVGMKRGTPSRPCASKKTFKEIILLLSCEKTAPTATAESAI